MSATSKRNTEFAAAAVKLGIFTVVSILVTGLLAVIMGNFGFGDTRTVKAVFTDASSLTPGDDVRVAGVSVGEVEDVEHYRRSQALVTFSVDTQVPLTTGSTAAIRFLNLVGDRYLALAEGDSKGAEPLDDGDTIPVDHTQPALDLTVLFNGFKPLFQALEPDQVNELSMNLVQVLQGEGGTVRSLLDHTASLTNTLADRDQLIGQVVDNLDTTLTTVDQRHEQLEDLIVQLKRWMGDLAQDRETIGGSLDQISDLTVVVADLLREGRPLVKSDVAKLRRLAALLNKPQATKQVTEIFDRLPESMTDQTRTGTYGSWYNYYLCGFSGSITFPQVDGVPNALLAKLNDQLTQLRFRSTAARCSDAEIP